MAEQLLRRLPKTTLVTESISSGFVPRCLLLSTLLLAALDCLPLQALPFFKMENMNTNILSTYRFWAASSVASSILLVHFASNYSVGRSYTWTATSLFLLQWLVYGIYSVILYPRYISPLRHLPMPSVYQHLRAIWIAAKVFLRVLRSSWVTFQPFQLTLLEFLCKDGSTKFLITVLFVTCKIRLREPRQYRASAE